MRQLTLGVQLKERATFASFLTARNVELVAHLQHVAGEHAAGRHLARRPAHRRQVAPAAGGVRGRRAGKRAAYLPLETLLPFGPGALDGAETLDVACYDDVQVDRRPRRLGAAPVFAVAARAGAQYDAAVRGARESRRTCDFGLRI